MGPGESFFRLVLSAATSDPLIFSGPHNGRYPVHSTSALLEKKYQYVGKLIAISIVQGGPGPSCFT